MTKRPQVDFLDALDEFQSQVAQWSYKNFGAQESWKPLLGVGEEVGELNHAHLKGAQGIRSGKRENETVSKKMDAVGDIVIFLADYCSREGLSLGTCVQLAWLEVRARDWKTDA